MARIKTNILSKLVYCLAGAILCIGLVSYGVTSAAISEFEQEVIDPTTPPDACPNIAGNQPTVPNGMQIDTNGDCYTPQPPTQPSTPVTSDLCSNLTGTQTTLPTGYYRTGEGNCYLQPTPPAAPVDVCPNLDEVQSVMPEGSYLNTDGSCQLLPQPLDECPTIPGPQLSIPDGMRRENGVCFTPAPTTPTPPQSEEAPLNGVPTFFQPVARFFYNLVPEGMRIWLKELPADTAKTIPYTTFILVGVLALIPVWQAVREALFVRQLQLLIARGKNIAEQKDNFVSLISHYLRTPLTLMKNGLDTIVSQKELPAATVEPLAGHLNQLDTHVTSVLAAVTNNTALQTIQPPIIPAEKRPVWRSGWFLGPLISSVVFVVIANFLLVVVGGLQVGTTDVFLHFIVGAVSLLILYLAVRNLYLQRKLHTENQALIDHERKVDTARNSFIAETTSTLQDGLAPITQVKSSIDTAPSAKYFNEGYSRIASVLERFLLLSHIETATERSFEPFELHDAIDQLIVSYEPSIGAKNVTVSNQTPVTFIKQDRLLFNFVLSSVLDNAIKFNQTGGTIEIGAAPDSKMLVIKVTDSGIGIEPDKLSQLFKPFSRTTSAVEFNYEGLGFSLFLDKIIMDYTGGSITASANSPQGATFTIATPVAVTTS